MCIIKKRQTYTNIITKHISKSLTRLHKYYNKEYLNKSFSETPITRNISNSHVKPLSTCYEVPSKRKANLGVHFERSYPD